MYHKIIRTTVFLRKTNTPLTNTATGIELYSKKNYREKFNFNTTT